MSQCIQYRVTYISSTTIHDSEKSPTPVMSESDLPEELLEKILALHLVVVPCEPSSYSFRRGEQSDFQPSHYLASILRRSHQLLLVSKRWQRIGTPLLYSSVALTTPNAVRSLANALRACRELGSAIRVLFLAHGSSKELYTIAKRAPAIRVLHLLTRGPIFTTT